MSRGTQVPTRLCATTTTGLSPALAGLSMPVRLALLMPCHGPYNPQSISTLGLAWSPFARRY